MKILNFPALLFYAITSLIAPSVFAATTINVRIDYVHPERFTDFRIQGLGSPQSAQLFSDELARYLSPVVARLAPGSTLTLRFTDIDLAGRYEPWRGPEFNNIRFVRDDVAPLRMYFDYQLVDGKGVKAGSKAIADVDYQQRFGIAYRSTSSTDRLFYEKQELKRWTESVLKPGVAY
jgi:Protein of unknown function (DUF3016)